ncbi:oxidoreductase [Paenibacillus arenilitoris]|uniref:Probable oxidoreductase n=1 Tax=Paenibacillus arenilitoris TaxID=2772299 RepID=A0A927CKX7_9BACL|nr:oxidoreductase [Paenibacillus arenilitoris]MBD2868672.1 SDR family NAD(P)-dependent oxidoreductase [Paenibacillus arenilitoris]
MSTELTKHEPVGSGFGPRTTAQEALEGKDLTGKVAIVTGGYSGLGLETTRVLAGAGATVIVPVRSLEKAREILQNIPGVEMDTMDLADPESIDAFAERFLRSGRPLHMLINGAGVMTPASLERDQRGYEVQFSVNHLGHFHLTARLWPALKQAGGARVVTVSSQGHRLAGVDFEDPNYEKREYEKWGAYAQSKTANVLFTAELDKRGKADQVRAFSVHPGTVIATSLSRHMSHEELEAAGAFDTSGRLYSDYGDDLKTIAEGAATAVWAAVSNKLDGKGGVYLKNVDIAKVFPTDSDVHDGVTPFAVDPENAVKLWTLSEKLTGVCFLD